MPVSLRMLLPHFLHFRIPVSSVGDSSWRCVLFSTRPGETAIMAALPLSFVEAASQILWLRPHRFGFSIAGRSARHLRAHGISGHPAGLVHQSRPDDIHLLRGSGRHPAGVLGRNFDTAEAAKRYFGTEAFAKNSIGVKFDPENLPRQLRVGYACGNDVSERTIHRKEMAMALMTVGRLSTRSHPSGLHWDHWRGLGRSEAIATGYGPAQGRSGDS